MNGRSTLAIMAIPLARHDVGSGNGVLLEVDLSVSDAQAVDAAAKELGALGRMQEALTSMNPPDENVTPGVQDFQRTLGIR